MSTPPRVKLALRPRGRNSKAPESVYIDVIQANIRGGGSESAFGDGREEESIQSAADTGDQLDWQEQASCRDYDNSLFFGPDQGESELEKQARESRAKAVCQTCPVSEPCLEFAMETNQKYGIWGGMSDKERASLKRRRARARRAS